ncbi:L-2-hydroxyglutarate oxidase [Bradyrhizobium sp. Cp5.3]|uniref:L-2-hydroxyglutarate oxidase n=1 Tax=Bradyrhizobium sp. Cp5.3 TaxID=443598 RepID=UPI001FD94529|nr:L-2-hydroxyglutarate oxidase [Bradyrhizobium sp. Cp5.3]
MLDHAGISVEVFEKEPDVALHQSSHNSGVVHGGLYYEPGSLKARLCARGRDLIKTYCATHSLPYDECGKLVVALSEDELPRLENIFRKSVGNGVPDIRMLDAEEIRDIEPNCIGIKALYSPRTAIVSYGQIAKQFAIDIQHLGGEIRVSANVTKITETNDGIFLEGDGSPLHEAAFDHVISCAGLQSDRLAKISGDRPDPKIVPFSGQYYVIDRDFRDHVKGLIYPVPDPRFPFLGVHFTKRIDGEMTIGPNAFISFGRENYSGRSINLNDVGDLLLYPGFWRFAVRNVPMALRELKTVISEAAFLREAAKYVPSLSSVTVSPAVRGIRAQAMMGNGSLVDDFVIRRCGRVTHIRNAPSPGATSSMAIAEYITREILAIK